MMNSAYINTGNFFTYLVLLNIILLAGCQSEVIFREERTEINPRFSTDFIRYDRMIEDLDSDDLLADYESQAGTIPSFKKIHDQQLLGIQNPEMLEQELRMMQTDTSFRNLYEKVQTILGDLDDIRPALNQTIDNYTVLSEKTIGQAPDIYGFISGFTYQTFLFNDRGKDGVGIGLDMFLGSEFPYEEVHPSNPSFSSYLTRTYNKDHMPRKVAEVLAEDMLGPPNKADFLTLMIWGGKKLYLIDKMISFAPDSIVTEYTQEQLDWCRNNESEIWSFFFEHELFYETNLKKFNKLISPAPTSPGMPPESPGQTANYMGWQVIKAYMKRNPNTSVLEMINMKDAQEILDLSKYKPSR